MRVAPWTDYLRQLTCSIIERIHREGIYSNGVEAISFQLGDICRADSWVGVSDD